MPHEQLKPLKELAKQLQKKQFVAVDETVDVEEIKNMSMRQLGHVARVVINGIAANSKRRKKKKDTMSSSRKGTRSRMSGRD